MLLPAHFQGKNSQTYSGQGRRGSTGNLFKFGYQFLLLFPIGVHHVTAIVSILSSAQISALTHRLKTDEKRIYRERQPQIHATLKDLQKRHSYRCQNSQI